MEELFTKAASEGQAKIAGIGQMVAGGIQTIIGNRKLKKALKERKENPYIRPKEIDDIVNATQFRASTGFTSPTMDFLTNSVEKGFSSSVDAVTRLGGDPNSVANLYDRQLESMLKIGADNEAIKLQNFDRFLNAKDTLAQYKDAEFIWQDNIRKDEMQRWGQMVQAGQQNLQSGANLFLAGSSAKQTAGMLEQPVNSPYTSRLSPPAHNANVYGTSDFEYPQLNTRLTGTVRGSARPVYPNFNLDTTTI